jgi:hypothetical protein
MLAWLSVADVAVLLGIVAVLLAGGAVLLKYGAGSRQAGEVAGAPLAKNPPREDEVLAQLRIAYDDTSYARHDFTPKKADADAEALTPKERLLRRLQGSKEGDAGDGYADDEAAIDKAAAEQLAAAQSFLENYND